jgi:hypothetical protein
MSALCMENLPLGQDAKDTHLCSVLRTSYQWTRHSFMFCPKDKYSMHKTLIYVVSALCIENFTLGQDINECLMHGELVLRTAHK